MSLNPFHSKNKKISWFQKNKLTIIGATVVVGALAYSFFSTGTSVPKSEKKNDCDKCDCNEDDQKEALSSIKNNNILYPTPMDAFKYGKREKLLLTTATRTQNESVDAGPDFIAVVDVDPLSPTYCQIINQCNLGKNDEVHHSGWNACASCFGVSGMNRKYLVVPAFTSGNIYFIDVKDPKNLRLHKTLKGSDIEKNFGLSYPHTPHCLANGQIMISYLGVDPTHDHHEVHDGADFLLIDGDTLEINKLNPRWVKKEEERPEFGYDYWYQPYHNIMISTGWGAPDAFSKGFNPAHVKENKYGSSIDFWDWEKHTKIKTVKFDSNSVVMPLEIRFFHDPKSSHAVCGAALSSNIIHIFKNSISNEWETNAEYIRIEGIEMSNWALPTMPSLITDVIISMNDKYIYFSNWLHGDIRQYDITDPFKPKLNSQCFIGGCLREDSGFNVKDKIKNPPPIVPKIKNQRIIGGPQMLQLSLDGKRLYVTNSLYTPYDKQFYPNLVKNGGQLLMVDIDLENDGKMKLNTDFIVDFGKCKGGASRPHEMRYPGGDCTSDIFLVQD